MSAVTYSHSNLGRSVGISVLIAVSHSFCIVDAGCVGEQVSGMSRDCCGGFVWSAKKKWVSMVLPALSYYRSHILFVVLFQIVCVVFRPDR